MKAGHSFNAPRDPRRLAFALYDVRFGLHEVDRQTFVRTPKPSAAVYSAIARANAVGTG